MATLDWLRSDEGERLNPNAKIISVGRIVAAPWNARQKYSEVTLRELGVSIAKDGMLHPPVVRPLPDGTYQLIAGHRRWLAAQIAGIEEIPVSVRPDIDDRQARYLSYIENLQREDLAPSVVQDLLATMEKEVEGRREISRILKKDESWVSSHLKPLEDDIAREALLAGEINFKQALEIARAENDGLKHILAEKARLGIGAQRLRSLRFQNEGYESTDATITRGLSGQIVGPTTTSTPSNVVPLPPMQVELDSDVKQKMTVIQRLRLLVLPYLDQVRAGDTEVKREAIVLANDILDAASA